MKSKTVIEVPSWEELAGKVGMNAQWNSLRKQGYFTIGEIAASWDAPLSTAKRRVDLLLSNGVFVRERAVRPTGGYSWLYKKKP